MLTFLLHFNAFMTGLNFYCIVTDIISGRSPIASILITLFWVFNTSLVYYQRKMIRDKENVFKDIKNPGRLLA